MFRKVWVLVATWARCNLLCAWRNGRLQKRLQRRTFHAWVRGIAGRIIFAFPDKAFKKIWGFGHENPAWDLIINYVIKIGIYPR